MISTTDQVRALSLQHPCIYTMCFAVWTIFSIIGVQIKQQLWGSRIPSLVFWLEHQFSQVP
jgi:nitrate/nitrite transporter NarK